MITDRLWLWAGYGRNQIDLVTTGGAPDDTTLENLNVKLNAEPFRGNAAMFFYYHADKLKFGRDASLTRPPETTWDQSGPADTFKLEDSQVFNSDLFGTLAGSLTNYGFDLVPQGAGQMRQDGTQTFHNTYYTARYYRPNSQIGGSLSYFLRTGSAQPRAQARRLLSLQQGEGSPAVRRECRGL